MNLITLKAAMEKGGFKRSKAGKLIKEGKIDAYKDGPRVLIDADSLDRYQSTLEKMPSITA
jgi:excisionase family DNA binding protein